MTEHRAQSGLVRRLRGATITLLAFAGLATLPATAQEPEPVLSQDALVDLVAPVALYPDDLLAIVLPASTYPLQVVEAQRLLEARETDPGLEPDPEWDDSVVALLNYPEVVELLNDDLDWTWQLGEAVLAQQGDVLEAVELFRDDAWLAGNLKSDEYQTVERSDEGIVIRPAARDVVYVPYYDPAVVVVESRWPVYHYHPYAYPLYYYPYPVGHRFYSDWFWGVSTAFAISWRHHYLHLHYYDRVGHPYYGRRYLADRYYRHRRALDHHIYRNGVRVVHREGQAYRWHPRRRHGARPGYRRYGARDAVTLGYDDRSTRRGRTERAARINNERRQRYRGVDNVIDRDRRGARRDRDRDRRSDTTRRRDTAVGGSRTQRFAANGGNRDGARRDTRRRDTVTDGSSRTRRFASGGNNRDGARHDARRRDADSTQRRRTPTASGSRTQRFASNGNREARTGAPNRERRATGADRRVRQPAAGRRDATPPRPAENRDRSTTRRYSTDSRRPPPSRAAPNPSRSDRGARSGPAPRSQGSSRAETRGSSRPAKRASSGKRERRSGGERRRSRN